jgi:hypothetical protein
MDSSGAISRKPEETLVLTTNDQKVTSMIAELIANATSANRIRSYLVQDYLYAEFEFSQMISIAYLLLLLRPLSPSLLSPGFDKASQLGRVFIAFTSSLSKMSSVLLHPPGQPVLLFFNGTQQQSFSQSKYSRVLIGAVWTPKKLIDALFKAKKKLRAVCTTASPRSITFEENKLLPKGSVHSSESDLALLDTEMTSMRQELQGLKEQVNDIKTTQIEILNLLRSLKIDKQIA